jgi:hypothetical protein
MSSSLYCTIKVSPYLSPSRVGIMGGHTRSSGLVCMYIGFAFRGGGVEETFMTYTEIPFCLLAYLLVAHRFWMGKRTLRKSTTKNAGRHYT